ncbi:MAG: sugar ABC transporter permease [Clostridia bacterium]|nr:sugar ABC transporter permease [Clostridia bacterium]
MRNTMCKWWPLFLLPTFAAFCIGFLYPFVKGIFMSFTSFKTMSNYKWVGLDNYAKAFSDPTFVHAFWLTALFTVLSLVIINVLAFAIAYGLTREIRGANLFRSVFFLPNLIGGIVLGYIWRMVFTGILSYFNTNLDLNSTVGFWALIIVVAWQQIGYMMIIYIAGLMAVPNDMIEAAKIDGATGWQTLWNVTIPNMMPSITICTFLTLTNSFKLFDQNLALTGGNPVTATGVKLTELLALNIYNTFNINWKWHGVAQAKAVVFFILVAVIALIQLRVTRSKEVQQ